MKQEQLLESPFSKNVEDKIHIQIGKNVKKLREKQHFNIIHLAKIACVLGKPLEAFFEGVDEILVKNCKQ